MSYEVSMFSIFETIGRVITQLQGITHHKDIFCYLRTLISYL